MSRDDDPPNVPGSDDEPEFDPHKDEKRERMLDRFLKLAEKQAEDMERQQREQEKYLKEEHARRVAARHLHIPMPPAVGGYGNIVRDPLVIQIRPIDNGFVMTYTEVCTPPQAVAQPGSHPESGLPPAPPPEAMAASALAAGDPLVGGAVPVPTAIMRVRPVEVFFHGPQTAIQHVEKALASLRKIADFKAAAAQATGGAIGGMPGDPGAF